MENAEIETQQSFLKSAIDNDINTLIEEDISSTSTVEECIEAIQNLFFVGTLFSLDDGYSSVSSSRRLTALQPGTQNSGRKSVRRTWSI